MEQTERKSFVEIINTEPLVLVDFFAEWCGPCKMLKPILEEVKSAIGDKAKILKVDVDKNVKVSTHYQVTGVPTLILFKKGRVVWRQSGVASPASIRQAIEANQ